MSKPFLWGHPLHTDEEENEQETLIELAGRPMVQCECGTAKTYGKEVADAAGLHSDYCPLYKEKPK
jgi:hypothetical protein